MRKVFWWQFGLLGGVVLSLATARKAVVAVAFGGADGGGWGEAVGFAAAVFGIGFLCGVVVWAGRGLHVRLGMAGDALLGMAVMVEFFLACMMLFEPAMLTDKFATGGAPMLLVAVVLGLIAGALVGRDIRRDAAATPGTPRVPPPPRGSEGDRPEG